MYKYSFKIFRRKDVVNGQGRSPLYFQAFVNGDRVRVKTNIYVTEREWDEEEMKVIRKDRGVMLKENKLISEFLNRAMNIFYDSEIGDSPLTGPKFREEFVAAGVEGDFVKFVEEEIERERATKARGTVKNYMKFYNAMVRWRKQIPFAMINYQFVVDWDRYLAGMDNRANTKAHYHKHMKKFINMAIRVGRMKVHPYKDFRVRSTKTEPVFLIEEEVQLMIDDYLEAGGSVYRQRVLRHFLFMCFTGLRYQDLAALERSAINREEMRLTPQKTQDTLGSITVPLSEHAMRLINDEAKDQGADRGAVVFRVISNQKMNDKLKVIAADLGINKRLSCHVGRHTFATLFLAAGNNIEVLQKLLGHADISTTMRYRHIMHKEKIQGLEKLQKFFNFG